MAIDVLEISQFRNIRQASLSPAPQQNLIVGKNGSGKTSILESIYVLGTGRSFRTPHSKTLINTDTEQFSVYGKLCNEERCLPVGVLRNRSEMKIKIAGDMASSASQLAEVLAVQIVNPDVHKLLEEGPRYRRRFIEWGVFHVEPHYFPLWQQCRQLLKQRNAALKSRVTARELTHWDTALCHAANQLTAFKENYLTALQPYVTGLLEAADGLPAIAMSLQKGWPKEKTLMDVLEASRISDYEKGFTQYGPHRSDLRIHADGVRAKERVSRGQQKLITALLKIAQVQHLSSVKPKGHIVLMVDDLPAELDKTNRYFLMNEIASVPVQTFVTATEVEQLPYSAPSSLPPKMFHVEHGTVRCD